MKHSLFGKSFLVMFALTLLVSFFVFSATVAVVRSVFLKAAESDLHKLAMAVREDLSSWPVASAPEKLDAYVKELGKKVAARISLIAPDGRVRADSETDPLHMENHGERPEVIAALKNRPRDALRHSSTLRQDMIYYALPLWRQGKIVAVLRLSLFYTHVTDILNQVQRSLLKTMALLLLASLFIAFLFSRHLSQPLRRLTQAARTVTAGNLESRVIFDRRDEIGELAEHFNTMVASQKELIGDMEQNRSRLEAVISSISEGLLVLNAAGQAVLSNRAFQSMVAGTDIPDKKYWELLRDTAFHNAYQQAINQNDPLQSTITVGERLFRAVFSPIIPQGGLVVTFHDISELKRVERMKRDFVVNLSHELRTPLTAIKGYVETMAEESEQPSRYLEIISRHTERMTRIVTDLLALAELEDRNVDIEKSSLDLHILINDTLKMFERRLVEKKLPLVCEFATDIDWRINADPFRLEQLFINLIDNALKYTDQGEIRISGKIEDDYACVTVADTGIGIPAKYLPRIFERFFVVDKSRSRASGGTGLGLAIVKHIVQLHNGRIDVQSTPGQGSIFTICLSRI